MTTGAVGKKIDDYARLMTKQLKAEEAQTGRKMTKYDVAMQMLSSGKLSQNEFASWMNTNEGFDAKTLSEQTKQALMRGSVFGMPGYLGGNEGYLDSLVSFSNKTPIEQQNIIHSPRQSKLTDTVAERKRQAAEMQAAIKQNKQKQAVLNPNKTIEEQKFRDHINSLPEVSQSYTELMNDIKFQELDKKGQVELLLKTTGQKFYEAKENGDIAAMKQYLIEGFGLAFAHMDNVSGITDLKEGFKKYSGLNALVDAVDKFVDDGDAANLTTGEKAWNMTKGVGDAVDSFIGTQGIAFIGVLEAASAAAAKAGIGKLFSVMVQGYFGIEGGTMVLSGAKNAIDATTEQEARTAGQEIGTGSIMLSGAVKSLKQGINGKMPKAAKREQQVKETADEASNSTKEVTVRQEGIDSEIIKKIRECELLKNVSTENTQKFLNYCINLGKTDIGRLERLVNCGILSSKAGAEDANKLISYMVEQAGKGFFSKKMTETYKKDWNIRKFNDINSIDKKIVTSGEVFEVRGKLFVNENGEMKPIKLSKEKFEELFELNRMYQTLQGNIGDCWFISALNGLMESPNGRAKLFQMFEESGDDIIVKIQTFDPSLKKNFMTAMFNKPYNSNDFKTFSIRFKNGDLNSTKLHGLNAAKGLQMLEQAYALVRLSNSRILPNNKLKQNRVTELSLYTDMDKVLQSLEGGHSVEFIGDIMGCIQYGKDILKDGNIVGKRCTIHEEIAQALEEYSDNPNVLFFASSKQTSKYKVSYPSKYKEDCIDPDISLYSNHAYVIKGFNKNTGRVYYSNPHNNSFIYELPLKDFTDIVEYVTYIKM